MDAETKQYLDSKFAELLTTMNAGFSRLERRPGMEILDRRVSDGLTNRTFR
ncbi:MAG: hypothetical protein ABR551_14965 [Gemmatimonadales bacterium]